MQVLNQNSPPCSSHISSSPYHQIFNSNRISTQSFSCRLLKIPLKHNLYNTTSSIGISGISSKPSYSSCISRKPPSGFQRLYPSMAGCRIHETERGQVRVSKTEEGLAQKLADYVEQLSEEAITARGSFSVVLSGGSLIKSLRKLTESPYADKIDWGRWHIFWADERVVPKDHEDSNYKLAYDGFISKVPIATGHVYSINDALSAEGAADDYETVLRQLVKTGILDVSKSGNFPTFDLMLLGMGPDGHVASLFPGHPLLSEKEKWVTFIKDSPKPPPERITLTFPVLNASANVCLVLTGSNKAGPLKKVFSKGSDNDLLPVQMVCPTSGKITWFTDEAAVENVFN